MELQEENNAAHSRIITKLITESDHLYFTVSDIMTINASHQLLMDTKEKSILSVTICNKIGKRILLKTDHTSLKKFGVNFLDRIKSTEGMTTVLGVCKDNKLWFLLHKTEAVITWNNHDNESDLYKRYCLLKSTEQNGDSATLKYRKILRTTLNQFFVKSEFDKFSCFLFYLEQRFENQKFDMQLTPVLIAQLLNEDIKKYPEIRYLVLSHLKNGEKYHLDNYKIGLEFYFKTKLIEAISKEDIKSIRSLLKNYQLKIENFSEDEREEIFSLLSVQISRSYRLVLLELLIAGFIDDFVTILEIIKNHINGNEFEKLLNCYSMLTLSSEAKTTDTLLSEFYIACNFSKDFTLDYLNYIVLRFATDGSFGKDCEIIKKYIFAYYNSNGIKEKNFQNLLTTISLFTTNTISNNAFFKTDNEKLEFFRKFVEIDLIDMDKAEQNKIKAELLDETDSENMDLLNFKPRNFIHILDDVLNLEAASKTDFFLSEQILLSFPIEEGSSSTFEQLTTSAVKNNKTLVLKNLKLAEIFQSKNATLAYNYILDAISIDPSFTHHFVCEASKAFNLSIRAITAILESIMTGVREKKDLVVKYWSLIEEILLRRAKIRPVLYQLLIMFYHDYLHLNKLGQTDSRVYQNILKGIVISEQNGMEISLNILYKFGNENLLFELASFYEESEIEKNILKSLELYLHIYDSTKLDMAKNKISVLRTCPYDSVKEKANKYFDSISIVSKVDHTDTQHNILYEIFLDTYHPRSDYEYHPYIIINNDVLKPVATKDRYFETMRNMCKTVPTNNAKKIFVQFYKDYKKTVNISKIKEESAAKLIEDILGKINTLTIKSKTNKPSFKLSNDINKMPNYYALAKVQNIPASEIINVFIKIAESAEENPLVSFFSSRHKEENNFYHWVANIQPPKSLAIEILEEDLPELYISLIS